MARTKAVYSSRKYQFGKRGMSKAYSGHTSIAAQGGETIPTPLADYFLELIRDSTFLMQEFKHVNMTADTFEIPKMTGKNSAYLIGEGLDMTTEGGSNQSSNSYSRTTWSSITLNAVKLGVLTGYSSELAEDSLISVANMTMIEAVKQMAEAIEQAWIWGDTTGAINSYAAGLPEKGFDGLVHQVPNSSAAPAGWTPVNTSHDNMIDAAQALLTRDHLSAFINKLELVTGSRKMDTMIIPPAIIGRFRDNIEFEDFQSVSHIGKEKAALLRGEVGDFYGVKIVASGFIPQGGQTSPATATGNYVSTAADTMILGYNKEAMLIGDRRALEIKKRHRFYQDVEEVRVLTRLAWETARAEYLAGIFDVKNSAVA
jgi:hypothetical protein